MKPAEQLAPYDDFAAALVDFEIAFAAANPRDARAKDADPITSCFTNREGIEL